MKASELNLSERRCMAIFLTMEMKRHAKDIEVIKQDLENLKKMGVDIDNLPDWGFVST